MGRPAWSRVLVAVSAAAALTLGLPTASQADTTVVVRGTDFPDARAQLAYIGCADLFERDEQVVQPYIARGPGEAPTGSRSLGYDLAGGTAIGSQHVVGSMVDTATASLSVFAREGAQGRAVAGYQEPDDAGTQLMWFGVAPVSAPAGGWHTVDATPLTYTWTKYDMATRQPTADPDPAAPTQTVAEFAAAHGGDGAGLYAITFGCDGAPFTMDAMRIGAPGNVTTYDLEGLAMSLSMSASASVVEPGQVVTFRGTLRSQTGAPLAHATVILERRLGFNGPWEQVLVVPAGGGADAVARLKPTESAAYRWRFVDRPLAEGTVSLPFPVSVLDPGTPPPDDPTPDPTPTPTPTPTLPPPPTETPTEAPTATTTPTTTPTPTPTLTTPPPSDAGSTDGSPDGAGDVSDAPTESATSTP